MITLTRLFGLVVPALFLTACLSVPPGRTDNVLDAFLVIPTEAKNIAVSNHLPVNEEGGHLQGVQLMQKGNQSYAVMSGSSSTYAYYAVAKLGQEKKTIGVYKILDKPYKHAGGFQIYRGLMAVGVEDNEAKDRSRVFVYRMAHPETPPKSPLAIIERQGAYKRATAGCIGLTELNDQLLLMVGDWDSKHLDFYTAPYPSQKTDTLSFELISTIDTELVDRSAWVDQEWLSYQNINLLKDAKDKVYLIGMAANADDQDTADLFELNTDNGKTFLLKKIARKNFGRQEKTKFRWGAGIFLTAKGKIRVVSCGENIREQAFLTLFQ